MQLLPPPLQSFFPVPIVIVTPAIAPLTTTIASVFSRVTRTTYPIATIITKLMSAIYTAAISTDTLVLEVSSMTKIVIVTQAIYTATARVSRRTMWAHMKPWASQVLPGLSSPLSQSR